MVKYLPAMWETRVQALGREDPLEKEITVLQYPVWKTPWTEEPDRLQSTGWQTVGSAEGLHFHFPLKRP